MSDLNRSFNNQGQSTPNSQAPFYRSGNYTAPNNYNPRNNRNFQQNRFNQHNSPNSSRFQNFGNHQNNRFKKDLQQQHYGSQQNQYKKEEGIAAYYHPSMIVDPWKELEMQYQQNHQQSAVQNDEISPTTKSSD